MEKIRTIAGRIDSAFSTLLMAKDVIEKIIPESDDEHARALAAQFVAQLIKATVEQLIPTADDDAGTRELPDTVSRMFDATGRPSRSQMIDTVDIDTQIARHLNHLPAAPPSPLPVR
jgi:hypothetical protein